jgi:hypothetical protein
VSYAAITLCVAPQRVFMVVVYFVIDSVWKHLDTPSYNEYTLMDELTKKSMEAWAGWKVD